MTKRPTKLMGMSFTAFKELASSGEEFHLQTARLIPFYKPGDEMTLTSIFLASLRLINEFRNNIGKEIDLRRGGTLHVFTEIEFLLFDNKRIDGLILLVKANKIADAVFVEVKNKNNHLDETQITEYSQIAKDYGVKKLLTISNQFVSFSTQSPISAKTPKSVSLYHLSWSYILSIAHLLLMDNNNDIEDKDQASIMNEVVNYFETTNSGVVGFTSMKPGWTNVTEKISSGASLKIGDDSVGEAISSWLQEERDMALVLSRELGLLVRSGQKKYKHNLPERIKYEKRHLIDKRYLESTLQIDGTASDLIVRPIFSRKNIEMSVTLDAPQDRKTKSQITWLRNQLKSCKRKNTALFEKLEKDLMVDIAVKFSSKPTRIPISELEDAFEQIGSKEIKSFSITQTKYLGSQFGSRKLIVKRLEEMLIEYYQAIVQNIKKWEKPAPKVKKSEIDAEPKPDTPPSFQSIWWINR